MEKKPAEKQSKRQRKGIPPCFKKRCWALKHTCHCFRSNKTVPFHPPSDLDPSEPWPGPSGQTCLRVFNTTLLQSPTSSGTGGPDRLFPASVIQKHVKASADLRPFLMLYELGKKLGEGCFGSVYEGMRKSDGQQVAIKFIPKMSFDQYINIPGHSKPLLTEVALNLMLLKPKKCPNIVELLDWFEEQKCNILIMELPQPCKTLNHIYMDHKCALNETQARILMRQVVNAAKHCIEHKVYHGDLKLDNILVNTETMELKFIDFGCGRVITPCDDPLIWHIGNYAVGEMVHSLGDLLFTLLGCHMVNVVHKQSGINNPAIASLGLSEECIDLIDWCTSFEKAKRPTLDGFLEHAWFKMG